MEPLRILRIEMFPAADENHMWEYKALLTHAGRYYVVYAFDLDRGACVAQLFAKVAAVATDVGLIWDAPGDPPALPLGPPSPAYGEGWNDFGPDKFSDN